MLLCFLATARGCSFCVEQPGGSVMPSFPYFIYLAMQLDQLAWNIVRLPGPHFS